MKEVVVRTWCDYPGCREQQPDDRVQETFPTEVLVNVVSRGRPTKAITVELCEEHVGSLKSIFGFMKKYDQKDV